VRNWLRGLTNLPSLEAIEAAPAATPSSARMKRSPSGLPATWDEYLGTLSKKDRHEMRRKMRRLDSAGDIQMRIITTAEEAAPLLDTLFHLMRISNHHKEEFLDRPGMQEFFRDMTPHGDAGMLRLYVLTFDGQPVAMVHNLDVGAALHVQQRLRPAVLPLRRRPDVQGAADQGRDRDRAHGRRLHARR
jgi:CelD/BcsL family acetyltransferase involved in cellulose biosynthesis